jgi:hypothetical protein
MATHMSATRATRKRSSAIQPADALGIRVLAEEVVLPLSEVLENGPVAQPLPVHAGSKLLSGVPKER